MYEELREIYQSDEEEYDEKEQIESNNKGDDED